MGRIPGGDRVMPVVYTEVDGGRLGEERLTRRGGGFAGRIMRLFGCFSGSGSRSKVTSRVQLRLPRGDEIGLN